MRRHAILAAAAAVLAAALAAGPAAAQTTAQATAPGAPSAPDESAHPCAPGSQAPGQKTLSDKLDDCGGVIRPSTGMDPGIAKPAPDAGTSDMPVIRPDPNAKPE
jgi:hypothetical protein